MIGRPGSGAPGRLEGKREPAVDGGAGEVLAGHAHVAARPRVTESLQGREQEASGDAFEGAAREQLVEDVVHGGGVERGRGVHQALGQLLVQSPAGPIPGIALAGRAHAVDRRQRGRLASPDGRRSRARCPARVDHRAHRLDARDRVVVELPVVRSGSDGADDPVAPLPGAKHGNRDAGACRGLLDVVHGLCMVHASRHLTRARHARYRLAQTLDKGSTARRVPVYRPSKPSKGM